MGAQVISLRKRRLRRARNEVRRRKLFRAEGELALCAVLQAIEVLQANLDRAVEDFRQTRQQRKKVG